jgi:hypothetical protein
MYNVQDYSVLYNNMFIPLYVRVCILLTCGKHLHDHIISGKHCDKILKINGKYSRNKKKATNTKL